MIAIRTLIVEDHVEIRKLIRLVLERKTTCVIVGECSDGVQSVHQAQELQPDLILMDISIPKLNGLDAAQQIVDLSPNSKIVFLSQSQSPAIAQEAIRIGAAGYLLKSDANQLPRAIDAVLRGEVYISSRMKRLLHPETAKDS